MRAIALIPSAILIGVGAVFTGQGFGYIGGSFMTGSRFWGVTGIVLVLCGFGVLAVSARRGSPN
jgi:hypothetical protein